MSSYSDLAHLESVARSVVEYLIVWTTILVWDTLSTFPIEYRTIWKRDWTLLKVVFLLNRYGTIILETASAAIILTPMSLETCRRLYWIQPLTIVFVIIVCQAIMAIRIYAIYERERRMGYLLLSLVAIEAIGCVAAATQIAPLGLPTIIAQALELEGCLVVAKPGSAGKVVVVLAVFPFTFDTIILALAAYRTVMVHRQFGVKIPILKRVLRDGLLYYLAITATHVVTTVLWFQSDITVKSFNVPASIVLPSLMCSRLILSLLSHKRDVPSLQAFAGHVEPDPEEKPARMMNPYHPHRRTTVERFEDSNAATTTRVGSTSLEQPHDVTHDGVRRGRVEDATTPLTPATPLVVALSDRPRLSPSPSPSRPSLGTTTPPTTMTTAGLPPSAGGGGGGGGGPTASTPTRPGLSTRPSLTSRKSEQTLESVRSRRSQTTTTTTGPPGSGESSSVAIPLAIQVTTETVVSVMVDPVEDDERDGANTGTGLGTGTGTGGRSPAAASNAARRSRPSSGTVSLSPASARALASETLKDWPFFDPA